MKKALLIVASKGYQPLEYAGPKKALEEAGFEVITGSDKIGEATAKDGSVTYAEVVIEGINISDYEGLFFIGGPGALMYLDNENSYKLLREWQKSGKPYGAICISPRILAKAGVLSGKRSTGWDDDGELAEIFSSNGVDYVRDDVVVDDKVVTASGPEMARQFGEKIVEVLNK
jgi:protease I